MSWHDPSGPWQAAARRARRIAGWSMLGMLAFAGLQVAILAMVVGSSPSRVSVLLLAALGAPLVVFALAGRAMLRRGSALNRIPAADGHLCPKCLKPVEPAARSRPCPGCGRRYSTRALEAHWTQTALAPRSTLTTAWSRCNLRRRRALLGLGVTPGVRRARQVTGLAFIALAVLTTLIGQLLVVESTLQHVTRFAAYLFIPLGIVLASAPRAITESWRGCATCGYRQARDHHGDHCPECGATWDGPGTVIRPLRPQRAPVQLFVVMALALILPAIVSMQLFSTNLTPTSVLINRLATNSFAYNEFSELQRRTLSGDERLALAEALLTRRRNGDHAQLELELDAMVRSGTLPAAFVDRYFETTYDIRLVTERGAGATTDVRLGLTAVGNRSGTTGMETWAIFSGWTLDDGDRIGATATPVRATERLDPIRTGEPVPWAPTLRDVAPGTRIRGTVWLFVGPQPPEGWTIGPDGLPLVPPDAMWSRRFELTAP